MFSSEKEKKNARSRQWYWDNRERAIANSRKYQQEHRAEVAAKTRAYYWRNKDKWPSYGRRKRGLPEPTREQPSVCECCGRAESGRSLALDHCHVTGLFRGWLCSPCNTAIGALGDSTDGLKRALAYLEAFERSTRG